jgi:hypothetical protein
MRSVTFSNQITFKHHPYMFLVRKRLHARHKNKLVEMGSGEEVSTAQPPRSKAIHPHMQSYTLFGCMH